jgi:hypothetical protein
LSKWSGNKLIAVIIISLVAIALFAGAAVAAVSYLNDDDHNQDNGEVGTCEPGGDCDSCEEGCQEKGDCLSEEQCEQEGDCHREGLEQEDDHDCFEENHREGERDSKTGNGHGCR